MPSPTPSMRGVRWMRAPQDRRAAPMRTMRMFELRQAFDWLPQAVLLGTGAEELTAVSTDTRTVRRGDLFVALKGEKYDAHDFVADAIASGAAAVVVERWSEKIRPPALLVPDTRKALGWIAAGWRARFRLPLIAVTGSNGKTTVKEMIAAILAAHVGNEGAFATRGNLNNDVGVPLTLLSLAQAHRAAVIEARHEPCRRDRLAGRAGEADGGAGEQCAARAPGIPLRTRGNCCRERRGVRGAGRRRRRGVSRRRRPCQDLAGPGADPSDHRLRPHAAAAGPCGSRRPSGPLQRQHRRPAGRDRAQHRRSAQCSQRACRRGLRACDRRAAGGDRPGPEGVPAGCRPPAPAACRSGLRVDRRQLQRQSRFGARGDRRARRRTGAAAAGARRHGRSREPRDPNSTARSVATPASVASTACFAAGDMAREAVAVFGEGARHFESVESLAQTLAQVAARDPASTGDAGADDFASVLVKGSRFMRMERVVRALASEPAGGRAH